MNTQAAWSFHMLLPSYRTEAHAVFALAGRNGRIVREIYRTGYTREDAQSLVDYLNLRSGLGGAGDPALAEQRRRHDR